MIRLRAVTACVTAGFVLAGCALARVGPAEPPQTYDLVTSVGDTNTYTRRGRGLGRGLQLVVNEPIALRSLAGDRIAIRPSAAEIRYFGKASWSDQLPKLVQARMIESLGRSGRFSAVASSGERLDADVAVATEIRAFHIELQHDVPVARVNLYVRLIDQRRARVIVERNFSDATRASNDDPESGVIALNTSMQAVLPKVAAWAGRVRLKSARQAPRRRTRSRRNEQPDPDTSDLPLRDTQTDERETDPDARPPVSPDLLIGRRRDTGRL